MLLQHLFSSPHDTQYAVLYVVLTLMMFLKHYTKFPQNKCKNFENNPYIIVHKSHICDKAWIRHSQSSPCVVWCKTPELCVY